MDTKMTSKDTKNLFALLIRVLRGLVLRDLRGFEWHP